MLPAKSPYIGFDKNPGGLKTLWEKFHSGLIEPVDLEARFEPYQHLLLQEWQRCAELGVDVETTRARRLSEEDYRQRAHASRLLVESAVPVIRQAAQFMEHVPSIIILTDKTGCVLHLAGQPGILELAAERSGIVVGAQWDESSAGNNGMGTALRSKHPVHVVASEHFCEGWHRWSCAAAPIFDADGRTVLGAIDFTTRKADHRDEGLVLCVSNANSISARIALRRQREQYLLSSAFGQAAAHYPNNDLLALDASGRVTQHTPSERCRRIARSWTLASRADHAHDSVDVTDPDTGGLVGHIILLAQSVSRTAPTQRSGERDAPLPLAVQEVRQFGAFITRDPDTRHMLDQLQRVAATDVNILFIGETGTGKELLARHVHESSPRHSQPYLTLNCGAINAELVESTLFGYVRGAFSGADPRGRAGYFEAAGAGTLFLDEIGELPLPMQAALLRVLEDGSFSRVGSCERQQARCRIIAATNRDLKQLVAAGKFREDLYFRLRVIQKNIKPLRERRGDIPLLVERFVDMMRDKHALQPNDFTPAALATLKHHDWPGNVRELRNAVEAAMIYTACSMGPMRVDHLPLELRQSRPPGISATQDGHAATATASDGTLSEREHIIRALRKHRKVNATARALGMARSTLYRRFDELNINPRECLASDPVA